MAHLGQQMRHLARMAGMLSGEKVASAANAVEKRGEPPRLCSFRGGVEYDAPFHGMAAAFGVALLGLFLGVLVRTLEFPRSLHACVVEPVEILIFVEIAFAKKRIEFRVVSDSLRIQLEDIRKAEELTVLDVGRVRRSFILRIDNCGIEIVCADQNEPLFIEGLLGISAHANVLKDALCGKPDAC